MQRQWPKRNQTKISVLIWIIRHIVVIKIIRMLIKIQTGLLSFFKASTKTYRIFCRFYMFFNLVSFWNGKGTKNCLYHLQHLIQCNTITIVKECKQNWNLYKSYAIQCPDNVLIHQVKLHLIKKKKKKNYLNFCWSYMYAYMKNLK